MKASDSNKTGIVDAAKAPAPRRGPLHVCLVETAPDGSKGSMRRYADLIVQAFSGDDRVVIHRRTLARPPGHWRRLPSQVQTLAHHASVFFSAWRLGRQRDFDLFHVTDGSHGYAVSRLLNRPVFVTVHDVIPALQAKGRFATPRPGRAAGLVIRASLGGVGQSTGVACDSQASQTDLVEMVPKVTGLCSVIHPPLEPGFFVSDAAENGPRLSEMGRVNEKKSGSGKLGDVVPNLPFLFHIGNNAFYKNRAGVVEVFARLANRVPHRLVMAGPKPGMGLIALADRLGVRDRVDFVVDPTDDDVRRLYRESELLLFPSVYEGFGWPPLEAMASGCPVVCTRAGSLAEVVGDAGLVCDVGDTDALVDCCLRVLSDASLADRMRRDGREHAKRFSLGRFRDQLAEFWGIV